MTTNDRLDEERRAMLRRFVRATAKRCVCLFRQGKILRIEHASVLNNSPDHDALIVNLSHKGLDGSATQIMSLRSLCHNARIVSRHEAFFLLLECEHA